ncbi:MAG TPA: hypothetical protein PLS20_09500, partial [Ruminococcus flavefaciens]|nr:hypothetical protein [Ruminococcus flavefaciens]
ILFVAHNAPVNSVEYGFSCPKTDGINTLLIKSNASGSTNTGMGWNTTGGDPKCVYNGTIKMDSNGVFSHTTSILTCSAFSTSSALLPPISVTNLRAYRANGNLIFNAVYSKASFLVGDMNNDQKINIIDSRYWKEMSNLYGLDRRYTPSDMTRDGRNPIYKLDIDNNGKISRRDGFLLDEFIRYEIPFES